MTAKILVPIDLSPNTQAVVSWASSLARDRNASLILLYVQQPVADSSGGEVLFPMPFVEDAALRRKLEEIVPDDPDLVCSHRYVLGMAGEQILQIANEEHVDLIIMGSHGRRQLVRFLMGSVAEHVMRHARCPVLVVKQQCHPPTDEQAKASVSELASR